MSLRIFSGLAALALLTACGGAEDGATAAASETRVDCAMGGAEAFDRTCTLDRMTSADGTVLVVGRADAGYRRLLMTTDGRGLIAADGVDAARVTIVSDGLIEVAVAGDRFRLPANTDGVP